MALGGDKLLYLASCTGPTSTSTGSDSEHGCNEAHMLPMGEGG